MLPLMILMLVCSRPFSRCWLLARATALCPQIWPQVLRNCGRHFEGSSTSSAAGSSRASSWQRARGLELCPQIWPQVLRNCGRHFEGRSSSAAGSSRATSWQRAEAWKSALRFGRKFFGIAGADLRAALLAHGLHSTTCAVRGGQGMVGNWQLVRESERGRDRQGEIPARGWD